MDKKRMFVKKMIELFELGEEIVDNFYENSGEDADMDIFTEEIEIMCLHLETSLDILKKI